MNQMFRVNNCVDDNYCMHAFPNLFIAVYINDKHCIAYSKAYTHNRSLMDTGSFPDPL
jgi:hypothetical protein